MTDDETEKELRLELLATDVKLRRKQEFWETPRNIAILIGVTAAIAAAIGFWLGRASSPAPGLTPVLGGGGADPVTRGEFMDAVQTAGIIVIAAMLVYVVARLDRALTAAAREIRSALTTQSNLARALDQTARRLESVENSIRERNSILPTDRLGQALDEIRSRLDRLEGKNENPPVDH